MFSYPQSSSRIRRKAHFQHVFTTGKRVENSVARLYYSSIFEDEASQAFVASKKVGNAVYRNKSKRRLKEICRHNKALIGDKDLIFVVKKSLCKMSYLDANNQIESLLKRINRTK